MFVSHCKNPQISVASDSGGSLGPVRGGRLPPSLGGSARTQFGDLWSTELCWKGLL